MLKALKNDFSLFVFKNQNNVLYNVFNKIYEKLKTDLQNSNTITQNYKKFGYTKSLLVPSAEIDLINNKIKTSKKTFFNNVTNYEFDYELRELIKELFKKNFSQVIEAFSKFYASRIIVSHIKIFTNHGFDERENNNNQFFSERYHTDNYFFTYFKLFINLEDVNLKKGPLHFVPKLNTKNFLKISKYKNRHSYNENNVENLIYKNTGQKGQSLFVNTTQCVHRAGVPDKDKSRTILLFHLNAIPGSKRNINYFEYENSKNNIFFSDYWSRYFAKPVKISDNLRLFKNFFL